MFKMKEYLNDWARIGATDSTCRLKVATRIECVSHGMFDLFGIYFRTFPCTRGHKATHHSSTKRKIKANIKSREHHVFLEQLW